MTYFGTRLSPNLSRREPEGYLICLNVPVARSGTQEYLPSELGLPEADDHLIPVFRPPEEVFSPACMASFEGMPVTDDHPRAPEGVTAENIRFLQKGHAHNVRRAAAPEDDLLLADLIVTDPTLIEEILAGKREISCGYNYTLAEENGRYVQREIRGNHVAVVAAGRAGARVSIQDADLSKSSIWVTDPMLQPPGNQARMAKMIGERRSHEIERSNPNMKKSQWRAKVLARMAKDGDVEGMAELISEILEPAQEPPVNSSAPATPATPAAGDPLVSAVVSAVSAAADPAPEEAPVVIEAPTDQPVIVDCGAEILAALNRIIALLSGPAADCGDPARQADDLPEGEAGALAADPAAAAAVALPAAEAAEATAEAVVEAVAAALEETAPAAPASGDEDPVDQLVAEILEAAEPEIPAGEAEILSTVLEQEGTGDEDPDPDAEKPAADALRAALAAFRPQLRRMSPQARSRFNADVAARLRTLSRPTAGKAPSAYAALRQTADRTRDARSLGQKIMASRNANLRAR